VSSEPRTRPSKWWADPLSFVELFAVANIAFLSVDIGLAHDVNAFANPAEWIPLGFSLIAPVILGAAMALGGLRPPTTSDERSAVQRVAHALGLMVGWGAVAVGVAGLLFHLDSSFFEEQTLKNLVLQRRAD
jgi:hypothetical protein